jgi:hypothetical protein
MYMHYRITFNFVVISHSIVADDGASNTSRQPAAPWKVSEIAGNVEAQDCSADMLFRM